MKKRAEFYLDDNEPEKTAQRKQIHLNNTHGKRRSLQQSNSLAELKDFAVLLWGYVGLTKGSVDDFRSIFKHILLSKTSQPKQFKYTELCWRTLNICWWRVTEEDELNSGRKLNSASPHELAHWAAAEVLWCTCVRAGYYFFLADRKCAKWQLLWLL